MARTDGPAAGLEELLDDPPLVHRRGDGLAVTWGLEPAVLRWLVRRVAAGSATLETGCGLSTVAFALAGARHTCITPERAEVERVADWCAERDVSLEGVAFVVAHAEDVLPAMDEDGPLDLVLVDGSHAFPQAFIDAFYAGRRLRRGGLLVVDDTQLWTGGVLRDALGADPGWRLAEEWPLRTAAFEVVGEAWAPVGWTRQDYVRRRSVAGRGRWRDAAALLHAGRVRAALRRGMMSGP